MRTPACWTLGEAIEHRDAELTSRAGVTLTKGSLYTIRSAMRRIRCCENDGGVSIAHLGVSSYRAEDILAWFDHMVERHGKRYAWAAVTTLRDTLEFVRRRGVEVAELDFIKRPADLPKPPSHQRGSRRQKKPLPRLSSLPRLSIHSTLRVAVQHLLVESQKRFDHDDLKEHTLYCYHYFAKKLEEPCGYNEDGSPGPLMADITLEELHEDHVHDWFYVLEDKISKSTAFGMLKRLRFLLNWVGKRRVRIDYDPTEVMRRRVREKGCGYPRKAPQPFARHELPALRHAVNLLFQQRLREGRRRKYRGRKLAHFIGPIAALRVTLFIGARIGETARMCVRDMRGDAVFLPDTKTGAKRWLYLDREAGLVAALLASLVVEGPMFLFGGRNLHTFELCVCRWLRRACELAGFAKRRTHDLRHTYVHTGLQIGVPLKKLMLGVGHTSEKTTLKIYGDGADIFEAREASAAIAAQAYAPVDGPLERPQAWTEVDPDTMVGWAKEAVEAISGAWGVAG